MGGSNNFTFEATVEAIGDEGEGNVGSLDGHEPIEIIIEDSSLLKFQDMRVQSLNGEKTRSSSIYCTFKLKKGGPVSCLASGNCCALNYHSNGMLAPRDGWSRA